MRIISQLGYVDLPYEQTILFIQDDKIYATSQNDNFLIGKYQNTDQAGKVMDMLHEAYKDFATATNTSDFYTMFNNPKVFHLPKAEDVE